MPAGPLHSLLVANRGEIARRVLRSARRQSLRTVAVYSDADADAPFVGEADQAVRLPGTAPADTYLDGRRIIAAAVATGADAVHPGYGFLSENAGFARDCAAAGLVFVGPSPEVIEQMGSKLAAKELMAAAGVPVLAGTRAATPAEALVAARQIGWPLLVKATFGGGGRGMRVVRHEGELAEALAGAQREAAAAFGDPTVFVERYVEDPRHIEVQIFGDTQGTVVHLFERECSIQRRFQKIIEEAPSPGVDPALRAELGAAAVTAARALHYVGAGTVEFVVDREGRFSFLEVNTRLQVEHPVTEEVTGLDLVALQLSVAAGVPLPPEAVTPALSGHAVEARLYAEDVPAGFLPASGTLEAFEVPSGEGIRLDSAVTDGSVVSTHYDAMLAKVIAWGPAREVAVHRLADALAGARLHGVVTNRDLLVRTLRHPEFLEGHIDTGFLTRHDPAHLGRPLLAPEHRPVHAAAAALGARAGRHPATPGHAAVPTGWRNVGAGTQRCALTDGAGTLEVAYRAGRGGVTVEVDGQALGDVEIHASGADVVDLTVAGVRRRYAVARRGRDHWVDSPLGASAFEEQDRFPLPEDPAAAGSLLAPMPGAVARVLTAAGRRVVAGEVLVVLEAMKMEHPVRAPHAGIVGAVGVIEGQQVETGAVLVVVDDTPDGSGAVPTPSGP